MSKEVNDPSQVPEECIPFKEHTGKEFHIEVCKEGVSEERRKAREGGIKKAQQGRREVKNEEVFPGVTCCWEIRIKKCSWGLTTRVC